MAKETDIAWTDSTFNPFIGCTKVGPGCDNCYAEVQDSRKRWGGTTHWGAGVARYRTSASNWEQLLKWNKAAAKSGKVHRVFCASLADVFDNEVPDEWRCDLWRLIEAARHLSLLLVTKRIGNVARMVPSLDWLAMHDNVRILITVCNQEEADRDIPKLLALPCKNGISYEPALGLVDWTYLRVADRVTLDGLTGLHAGHSGPGTIERCLSELPSLPGQYRRGIEWVIVGGESGLRARPFDLAWARSTIEQCKAAGVPAFCKQLGARPYDSLQAWRMNGNREHSRPETVGAMTFKDRAGADPAEWPENLRVREFPDERTA